MKHYGDITKMKGDEIEPVWLITGGSPCQDLSCAGKRAGLAGERSGLFLEMIRIIKEMRSKYAYEGTEVGGGAVEPIRLPNWVLWENVPGALSSNNGEDFRCVLEQFARIKDETVSIPRPPKGRWSNTGEIVGNDWSIAWTIRDSQHFGVPQRRRRIALLVSFSDVDAGKILFKKCSGRESRPEVRFVSESLSGDSEPGSEEGQGSPGDPARSVGVTGCLNPWDVQSKHIQTGDGVAEALYSGECRYGGGESYVMDERPQAYTLKIRGGVEIDSYGKRAGKGALIQTELSGTLGVSQDQTLIEVDRVETPLLSV